MLLLLLITVNDNSQNKISNKIRMVEVLHIFIELMKYFANVFTLSMFQNIIIESVHVLIINWKYL